jgi:hypothetical protein
MEPKKRAEVAFRGSVRRGKVARVAFFVAGVMRVLTVFGLLGDEH